MTCPYCHVEYTEDRPCFCQPSSQQFECDSRDGEFADPASAGWLEQSVLDDRAGISATSAPRQQL